MKCLTEAAEFGKTLIESEDIDPIYSILNEAALPPDRVSAWCAAYWLFYHAGVASAASESDDPWGYLLKGYAGFPRGMERRHFRGAKGVDAIVWLSRRFGHPIQFVGWLFSGADDYDQVKARALNVPMFGDWICWKLADMGERVLGYQFRFEDKDLAMYKDPVQGAALVLTGDWRAEIAASEVKDVVKALRAALPLKAPPKFDRLVNVQEVETVLCKFKANRKGFYPIGKDSKDIAHALDPKWGPTADRLRLAVFKRCRLARGEHGVVEGQHAD